MLFKKLSDICLANVGRDERLEGEAEAGQAKGFN